MEPADELDLTDDYRLVAMDLRGHGLSDKTLGLHGIVVVGG